MEEGPRASPPAAPLVGSCYLVADAPTGEWEGQARKLAAFTSGGWRFVTPAEGLTVYVRSAGVPALFRAGAWEIGQLRGSALVVAGLQVVGERAGAIASPAGGSTVDAESRTAIGQIVAALRQHGLIAA